MTTPEFFDATPELTTIYRWARARYAAPKGVLGSTILRVSASTEAGLQLPGVIGGPASLNMGVVLVSKSGGGKGICDKVGAQVWPADITERPIGSGEGIAAMFMPPKKEGAAAVTRAILSVPEIDTLAGMANRQGNILLAQLKSTLMGELLGQSNASEATTRIVQAHTYRCSLSIGAQPGHTGVLFNDTTGGTPQRMIWLPTTDPDMPADQFPDPEPLNVNLPQWAKEGGVITYGPDEIRETIIQAHLARQRGEGDALDGHALLTRCKVAAVLAIMHHRTVVAELDWQLSETIMQWSNATRDWILSEAKRAERAKVRDRAAARAAGEDFYDATRLETVKRSILRMLDRDGEQQGNVLRSRLGRKEKRELFDQAIALLEAEGLVSQIPGLQKGARYRLSGQGDHGGQGAFTQVNHPDHVGQGDHPATVTDLDTRRSGELHQPKLSCAKWFDNYVIQRQAEGHTTITSFAAKAAASAEGYAENLLLQAIAAHPDVNMLERKGDNPVWSITGEPTGYQPVLSWFNGWLDALPANVSEVDKAALKQDCEAAGHRWESLRRDVVQRCPRIESVKNGRSTSWRIVAEDREDAS